MMTLHTWIGAFSFLIYAGVAFTGAVLCWRYLPETKGRTLVRPRLPDSWLCATDNA